MGHAKGLILTVLILLVMGSGCASLLGSKEQDISIKTVSNGEMLDDVQCSLNNSEGTWHVKTPGSATVHKSTSDLSINCVKESHPTGTSLVKSSANSTMLGNILLPGGLVGAVIDAKTGAGFDYPELITVAMGETSSESTHTEPQQYPVAMLPTKNADLISMKAVAEDSSKDCVVRGLVRFGEKFFFVPEDKKYYERAIESGSGGKWFCTEEDARFEGFRAIIK
jgi:hypothetical protein